MKKHAINVGPGCVLKNDMIQQLDNQLLHSPHGQLERQQLSFCGRKPGPWDGTDGLTTLDDTGVQVTGDVRNIVR
jgi:hypothetical protein